MCVTSVSFLSCLSNDGLLLLLLLRLKRRLVFRNLSSENFKSVRLSFMVEIVEIAIPR